MAGNLCHRSVNEFEMKVKSMKKLALNTRTEGMGYLLWSGLRIDVSAASDLREVLKKN